MPLSLGSRPRRGLKSLAPSPYWGEEAIWDTRANNHNSMFDRDGRLWLAATVRAAGESGVLPRGSDHPVWRNSYRTIARCGHLAVFDPKTKKYTFVGHLLRDASSASSATTRTRRWWTSGGGPGARWVNTKQVLQTGDAAKSQGWTAFVLDTNGNGKRDDYVGPNDPSIRRKDKRGRDAVLLDHAEPVSMDRSGAR
jgi:hypothetical protein